MNLKKIRPPIAVSIYYFLGLVSKLATQRRACLNNIWRLALSLNSGVLNAVSLTSGLYILMNKSDWYSDYNDLSYQLTLQYVLLVPLLEFCLKISGISYLMRIQLSLLYISYLPTYSIVELDCGVPCYDRLTSWVFSTTKLHCPKISLTWPHMCTTAAKFQLVYYGSLSDKFQVSHMLHVYHLSPLKNSPILPSWSHFNGSIYLLSFVIYTIYISTLSTIYMTEECSQYSTYPNT